MSDAINWNQHSNSRKNGGFLSTTSDCNIRNERKANVVPATEWQPDQALSL